MKVVPRQKKLKLQGNHFAKIYLFVLELPTTWIKKDLPRFALREEGSFSNSI